MGGEGVRFETTEISCLRTAWVSLTPVADVCALAMINQFFPNRRSETGKSCSSPLYKPQGCL